MGIGVATWAVWWGADCDLESGGGDEEGALEVEMGGY